MESNNTYYTDLIVGYFNGELSAEEMVLLSDWLKKDEENTKLFTEYKLTWELIAQTSVDETVDIDNEWNTFSKNNKTFLDKEDNIEKVISTNTASVISFKSIFRIAAIFVLLATSSYFLYQYFNNVETLHLIADNNSIQKSLPDGSNVTLNIGATIDYPEKFDKKERNVKLKGEAYFEVAHNTEQPFIIASGNIRIEVLGTKFYVNTEAVNNKVEVVLETGKVAVYYADKPNEKTIMEPGEKVELSKEEDIKAVKEQNDDENFIAWKTKKIVFNDNTLSEVVSLLNKVYNKKIKIKDKKVNNCRLTATFENQTIESILSVIQETLDVKVDSKGDNIEIKGVGCE
ncbi:MAG: FecR domain-containing protein [Bacteroidota bacterium]